MDNMRLLKILKPTPTRGGQQAFDSSKVVSTVIWFDVTGRSLTRVLIDYISVVFLLALGPKEPLHKTEHYFLLDMSRHTGNNVDRAEGHRLLVSSCARMYIESWDNAAGYISMLLKFSFLGSKCLNSEVDLTA